MSLENGRISSSQLSLMTLGFIVGSSVLVPPGLGARQDSWAAVLVGLAEGLLIAAVYVILIRRFKNRKTLDEICTTVLGPVAGRLVAALFIWYLLHLGSLVITNYADFFAMIVLPRTPTSVIAILLATACVMAVAGGLEVTARCAQVLVPFAILVFFSDITLMIGNFRPQNLLPLFQTPWPNFLMTSHGAATFPFGEAVAFAMVLPFVTQNGREGPLALVKGFLAGGLILAISAARVIATLGATSEIYTYPVFQAVRLINVRNVLTRLEVLVAIVVLTLGFIKITVLLFGAALGTAQILGLQSYHSVVLPVGAIMAVLSLVNFSDVTENLVFIQQAYPIYAVPFQVGIPLLVLFVALVRRMPRRES